ncbi:MAG: peptide deformylase [bacterium]
MAGKNRRVVLYGNPALRTKARRVERIDAETRRFFEDLKTTMVEQDGVGLAANQVGEPVAIIAVNPRGDDERPRPICVVNPEIVEREGEVEHEEGCLSLPGLFDVVLRPARVVVRGLDESGKPARYEATGLLARAFCHEIDHINGVLFIDHIGPTRRRMLAAKLAELQQREKAECG